MALPDIYNVSLTSGDTWMETFEIDTVDLSTSEVKIQLRKKAGAPLALEITTGDNGGLTILGEDSDIVKVNKQIELVGRYVYSLKVFFADGTEKTYVTGKFKLKPSIIE